MKHINSIILILYVFFTSSCGDVLEKSPLDEIGDDAFWTDPTLVNYYVNDLYAEIPVDGLQLQENRSDNSVSSQRDKWRASSFSFNYNTINASASGEDVWNS